MSPNSNQLFVSNIAIEDIADLIYSRVSEQLSSFFAKEDKIFTREQAAKYLQITVTTLDKYTKEGKIQRYDICNSGNPRYKQKDLDECLKPQVYINK